MVAFLEAALSVDLQLGGSEWLYEQVVANYFVANGRWPTVGEVYQRATRVLVVDETFERVIAMLAPDGPSNGDSEVKLTLEQLHRSRDTQAELDNFVQAIRLAVDADQAVARVTSDDAARELNLDSPALAKLGHLLSVAPDICREGEVVDGYSSWTFLPSYNVHFFRRAKTIDDYLAVVGNLNPRNGAGDVALTAPGPVDGELLRGWSRHLSNDRRRRVDTDLAAKASADVRRDEAPRPTLDRSHRGQRRHRAEGKGGGRQLLCGLPACDRRRGCCL